MAIPAVELAWRLGISCSSWRSLSRAASTAKVFSRAVMAASRGLRRASSSAWRKSALACSQLVLPFFGFGVAIRLRLDDLLLSLGKIGLRLFQLVLLLSGVELRHHVARPSPALRANCAGR